MPAEVESAMTTETQSVLPGNHGPEAGSSSEKSPDVEMGKPSRSLEATTLYVGPDKYAKLIGFLVRWRSRLPGWRVATMGVLTTSEREGVILLEAAVAGITDRRLRKLFSKHLVDERRHTAGFHALFDKLQIEAGNEPGPPPPARPMSEKFSVIGLMAYLEVQELRGEQMMRVYRGLFEGDEESVAFIDSVLSDEHFHATYTHLQLERWVKEGLGNEVRAARAEARAVDRKAFGIQVARFLRVMPRLLLAGHLPPLFRSKPAPLH
jgi:hypothetical protein